MIAPASPEHVRLVPFDPVLLQECPELIFERIFLVMLGLGLNVCDGVLDLRCADREGTVSFLPMEILEPALVRPLRRSTFDELHCLCDGHPGWKRQQQMNVVFDPADGQRVHLVGARDPAHVCPEVGLVFCGDCLLPVLGRKHAMNEKIRVCVRHGRDCRGAWHSRGLHSRFHASQCGTEVPSTSAVPAGLSRPTTRLPGSELPGYIHTAPDGAGWFADEGDGFSREGPAVTQEKQVPRG